MALRLPDAERALLGKVLAADLALLASLEAGIVAAEAAMAEVLAATPAGILTTLPGVAVLRASNYGTGIGDPSRFPNYDPAPILGYGVWAWTSSPPARLRHAARPEALVAQASVKLTATKPG